MSSPRILCIMGSGETAPTMVSVHADLIERMGGRGARAVLLDTPFGFQENADDLVARAKEYFHTNVGHELELATYRSADTASELDEETALARIDEADYVFAGPGSPSYAVQEWRRSRIPDRLRRKLEEGGCVVFASAAAVTLGVTSLPVYEIYKVGQPPHWLEGLDLLRPLSINAAVIPHFNNAEGGTHDTRFCYMGERRLRMLEEMLPEGAGVIGVDEHTALILDVDSGMAEVRGRGVVTVRREGLEAHHESGTRFPIDELRHVGAGAAPTAVASSAHVAADAAAPPAVSGGSPLRGVLAEQEERFDAAEAAGDAAGMVAAILAVESALVEWSADSQQSDDRDRGRELLRRLVVRLGDRAREGVADPKERVAPFVEAILAMRQEARRGGRYDEADRLRDALVECGVEVRDGRDGSGWELAEAAKAG